MQLESKISANTSKVHFPARGRGFVWFLTTRPKLKTKMELLCTNYKKNFKKRNKKERKNYKEKRIQVFPSQSCLSSQALWEVSQMASVHLNSKSSSLPKLPSITAPWRSQQPSQNSRGLPNNPTRCSQIRDTKKKSRKLVQVNWPPGNSSPCQALLFHYFPKECLLGIFQENSAESSDVWSWLEWSEGLSCSEQGKQSEHRFIPWSKEKSMTWK